MTSSKLYNCKVYVVFTLVVLGSVLGEETSADETNENDVSVENEPKMKADVMCEKYSNMFKKTVHFMPPAPPVTLNCQGRDNPLVVGGETALPNEFPHMAALGWRLKSGQIDYLCGGSLISEYWVLTAAHCAIRRPNFVILGTHDLNSTDAKNVYHIETMAWPSAFKLPTFYSDVALVKLSRRVFFGEKVRPACLRTRFDTVPRQAVVTGWGRTRYNESGSAVLQKASLEIIDNVQCAFKYQHGRLVPLSIVPSMLCAGDPKGSWKRDACKGDSGGPLQILRQDNCLYEIIGISSFGKSCALTDWPGVYTRVSYFVDLIENIVWPDDNFKNSKMHNRTQANYL